MATLSDLVDAVAAVTGLPKATIFAYGRFARQAGYIGQSGRGRSAAEMTLGDAANLLIAVAATGVTRDAGAAIETFRKLKGGRLWDFVYPVGGPIVHFLGQAAGGVRPPKNPGAELVQLQANFGQFLESLILATLDGQLSRLFAHIPSAEVPREMLKSWRLAKDFSNLDKGIDQLIEEGVIAPFKREELEFGEHYSLSIKFNRLVPSVEIEFQRLWESVETVGLVTFGPARGGLAKGQHRLQLQAGFTQHTLAAVGLVVANLTTPSSVASLKPVDALFAEQFKQEQQPWLATAWGR